jgi:hypothetical protein
MAWLTTFSFLVGWHSSIAQASPTINKCPVFPADNVWNARIDHLPIDSNSDAYVASIGAGESLHADFGAGSIEDGPIGIPFVVVSKNQPNVAIVFKGYADEPEPYVDESDPGPFPIPPDAPIEGGVDGDGDRHVIVVQERTCTLFELYKAVPNQDGTWNAVASAKFDLESNELRPDGWTSTDAAGLPIFPGLVRYDEVALGEIQHAIRFTAPKTRKAYVWPARHHASNSEDPGLPPMGQRFRLKSSFDISGFSPTNQIILKALKTYGMILADNGSPWFISGAPHNRWDNDELQQELRQLTGADFEAVDTSSLQVSSDSAAAKQ